MGNNYFDDMRREAEPQVDSGVQLIVDVPQSAKLREVVDFLKEHLEKACAIVRMGSGTSEFDFSGLVLRVVDQDSFVRNALEYGLIYDSQGGVREKISSALGDKFVRRGSLYYYQCESHPPELLINASSLANLGKFLSFAVLCGALTLHALSAKYKTFTQELSDLRQQYRQIPSMENVDLEDISKLVTRVLARFSWLFSYHTFYFQKHISSGVQRYLSLLRSSMKSEMLREISGVFRVAVTKLPGFLFYKAISSVLRPRTVVGRQSKKLMERLLNFQKFLESKGNEHYLELFFAYPSLIDALTSTEERIVINLRNQEDLSSVLKILDIGSEWRRRQVKSSRMPEIFLELPNGQVERYGESS